MIRKLVRSLMRIGKKVVWAGGRMGRGHWADNVLFVGVCVCVATKQMSDKTTTQVHKWPVTKATLRFSL